LNTGTYERDIKTGSYGNLSKDTGMFRRIDQRSKRHASHHATLYPIWDRCLACGAPRSGERFLCSLRIPSEVE